MKKEKQNIYTTVVSIYDSLDLRPGDMLVLTKEKSNPVDDEAIVVTKAGSDKHIYVANSVQTVIRGTYSAGRLYDKIGDTAIAKVKFVINNSSNPHIYQSAIVKIIGYYKHG